MAYDIQYMIVKSYRILKVDLDMNQNQRRWRERAALAQGLVRGKDLVIGINCFIVAIVLNSPVNMKHKGTC